MQPYEFLGYQPTPGEKHLGIATIKMWGRLILRWKVIPNKDGSGFFCGAASYKVPDPSGAGGDCYTEAFMLDSRSEHEAVQNFIRAHVRKAMGDGASVFGQQRVNQPQGGQSYPAQANTPPAQNQAGNSAYWEGMPDMPNNPPDQLPF